MKKIIYLLGISALSLIASCNNDDITESSSEVKEYTPVVKGSMEKFTDADTKTRAGVIEDNPNYAQGEQFYWVNGDKVKMLFFTNGDLGSTPVELTYTAVVPSGQKPSSCSFTTTGSITAGSYTVYGLYPAEGWSKDETGYKASMPSGSDVEQLDASSKHLGRNMFMKAKAENVTVGADGQIDMNFKHLSSVVRFHITDNTHPVPLLLNDVWIGVGDYSYATPGVVNFFPTQAYLAGGIDDASLTPVESSRNNLLYVSIMQYFEDNGTARVFDVFMPVLPTGAPVNPMYEKFYIRSRISYIGGQGFTTSEQTYGTYQSGLSFTTDIPFLANGFEAGKSYYFNLKTSAP